MNSTYELIRSLTAAEKVYFKKNANLHGSTGNKNYILLFDYLESMKSYDRKRVQKHFTGSSIAKYLSSEMGYLKEQILKSLLSFGLDSTEYNKNFKKIQFVHLYLERGMKKEALKLLVSVKKKLTIEEDYTTLINLIQIEEELIFRNGILDFTSKLMILNKERKEAYLKIQNLNNLRLLREQIKGLQWAQVYIVDEDKFADILSPPILDSPSNAISIKAKEHWYYIKAMSYYLARDYQSAQKVLIEWFPQMHSHADLMSPIQFLPLSSNLLYYCALNKDQTTFFQVSNELKEHFHIHELNNDYTYYITTSRTLELYYQLRQLSSISKLLDSAGEIFQVKKSNMVTSQVNYLYFLFTRSCILLQKYEEASDWIRQWQIFGILDYTKIHAYTFTLISHYELGWDVLLESEVETFAKNLSRFGKYDKFAKIIIASFRKLSKYPDDSKRIIFDLHQKIDKIKNVAVDNFAFEYFDFALWTKLHI